MTEHRVVSQAEWLRARRELLEEEKAFSKRRDALSAKRRALPWVKVEADYRFQTPHGERSLGDLFGPHRQLLVYHFMFGPEWEQGCPSCSYWADNFSGSEAHLAQRDMAFVAISRAPLDVLLAYRARMGWSFPWVSSAGSEFNFDLGVSARPDQLDGGEMTYNFETVEARHEELPGASAFFKDEDGTIYRTYSCYARGLDILNGTYHWMDIAPRGRDEGELPWPMAWVRRRDEYAGQL